MTGHFGLGFKSVFFVTDQPEVISGRLAFEVRGGFYPVPLPQPAAEALRAQAFELGGGSLVPTVVRLKWDDGQASSMPVSALDRFQKAAPLLAVFSRGISGLAFDIDGVQTTLRSVEKALTTSEQIHHIQVGSTAYMAFRCALRRDKSPATILLGLAPEGLVDLADDSPCLWITTPTAEASMMRWALNAPFKPDAGRQRLALNNPENRAIAEEISMQWGNALIELFDFIQEDWRELAETLHLHANVDPAHWWNSLWIQMTRERPVPDWDSVHNGGQVLGWVAWGHPAGGMRKLVQERPMVPSGLPGPYAQLVKSGLLLYKVNGMLATLGNGCFEKVMAWDSVLRHFPIEKTVSKDVASFLEEVNCVEDLESMTMERVMVLEVGAEHHAAPMAAHRIGELLSTCAPSFGEYSAEGGELRALDQWMREVNFQGEDGVYRAPTDLVCAEQVADMVDLDEVLRAAFAPPEAVLSSDYSQEAVLFFTRARGRLTAGAERLAGWVREDDSDQLPAVFRYLIEGDLAQELADQLGRDWFEAHRDSPAFVALSLDDQREIDRKFLRGQAWIMPATPIDPSPAPTVMPPAEAFQRISDWWQREQGRWVNRYQERTYPPEFPGAFPWRSDDAWDTPGSPSPQDRWLFLFINAALVPLGFNGIGRDQSFSRFLVENGWLDVLTNATDDPEALLSALDRYLETETHRVAYHFQMRQFVAFYAVARNMDAFVDTLYEANRSTDHGAFLHVFRPMANPILTGTGIEAPPVGSMLGIGACQLLRELYRLTVLTNPLGHRFAFTPLRKVRLLCAQLFGTPSDLRGEHMSDVLYSRLSDLADPTGADPTFNGCFDLPFQFLAEQADLRHRVLDVDFETDAVDNPELDAAPINPLHS